MKSFHLIITIIVILFLSSCTKLVEVDAPVTSTNGENVYQNDATAAAVLTGIYNNMSNADFKTSGSINSALTLYSGLSADELTLWNGIFETSVISYYKNTLINLSAPNIWSESYPVIYICNSAIEGLNSSSSLTSTVKRQLVGEAKFIRALEYFYVTNLYGNVPLALTTDYKVNSTLPRASREKVYEQIISDLKAAQDSLSEGFLNADIQSATVDRLRPSKWAATALLARVYLYTGDWVNAEAQSTILIDNTSLFELSSLDNAFLKASSGNKEAIFQLQPVRGGMNTQDGFTFIIPSEGPSLDHGFYLNNDLVDDFEPGDQRRTSWIDSVVVSGVTYHYPYKYKSAALNDPVTEHEMVLRLGEQYLIRAEASAQQNNTDGTVADLNAIRRRAGLGDYSGATDKASLLSAILHERRVELFTEWGHRWLDLKRTKNIDAVMTIAAPRKGGSWNTNQQWYPISLTELIADPALEQNAGY